ncbi:hypothetical protein E4T56_gene15908, partial [Termitomyces sp. T112]
MRARDHAARGLFGGKTGAQRETAADALGGCQNVGHHAELFIGIESAGTRHAALHLVKNQHQVMLVAQRAQSLKEGIIGHLDAAFALNRLDHDAAGVGADGRLHRFQITEIDIFEARQNRKEAFMHLFLIRRRDRPQGPPMKGLLESDQFIFVEIADMLVIGARGLDRAFHRFSARIGEEHRVGKGQFDQPLGHAFLMRAAVQVRDMHQRRGLLLDRADQPFMAVAQQVHGDPGGKVEISAAILANQMAMLTAHRPKGGPGNAPLNERGQFSIQTMFGRIFRGLTEFSDRAANAKWRRPEPIRSDLPPFARIYAVAAPGSNLSLKEIRSVPFGGYASSWARGSGSTLTRREVDRRVLASSIDFDIELQTVAFVDFTKTRTFDRADVHEGIGLAVITRDEAKAFHRVEELDRAGCLFTGQLTLGSSGPALGDRDHITHHRQIAGRPLAATTHQGEFQALTFGQTFKTGAFDRADVHEHIFAAVFTLDEAKTLLSVEKLYDALALTNDLGGHAATATAAAEATAATRAAA